MFINIKTTAATVTTRHCWSQVDTGGRGVLTPANIHGFLSELGLEPTSSDVLHIIDELDWSGSGIVSRWPPQPY